MIPRLLALLSFFFIPLWGSQETLHVSAAVTAIQQLTLQPTTVAAPAITEATLDAGFITLSQAMTAGVSSNVGWTLSLRSLDASMGTVGSYTKPLSHFLWKRSSSSSFTAITQTDALISSNTKGGRTTLPLDFKILMFWDDLPGTYSLHLLFTLAPK